MSYQCSTTYPQCFMGAVYLQVRLFARPHDRRGNFCPAVGDHDGECGQQANAQDGFDHLDCPSMIFCSAADRLSSAIDRDGAARAAIA